MVSKNMTRLNLKVSKSRVQRYERPEISVRDGLKEGRLCHSLAFKEKVTKHIFIYAALTIL